MTNDSARARWKHLGFYGELDLEDAHLIGQPIPEDFSLNSPIGVQRDDFGNIWLCDTGNGRVIVFDQELEIIRHILRQPGDAKKAGGDLKFSLPFHLCRHPKRRQMYLTDMGNHRVVVFDYTENEIRFAFAFGQANDGINQGNKKFSPLHDPNGITIVDDPEDGDVVYVNDEFFHSPEDNRSRCVKFSDSGQYITQFRGVAVDEEADPHGLLWPQGLSSDDQGNLYLANTGKYEILKVRHVDASIDVTQTHRVRAKGSKLLHSFGSPRGVGTLNIMRAVNVIHDRVFVPDQVANTISVYSTEGDFISLIAGTRPLWLHEIDGHCWQTFVEQEIEETVLVSPYQISEGDDAETYLITEPFSSLLKKVRIENFDSKISDTVLLKSIGGRRQEIRNESSSQFSAITSVIKLREKIPTPEGEQNSLDNLPPYMRFNPFQWGYMAFSNLATQQYQSWCRWWNPEAENGAIPGTTGDTVTYNIDAGNWAIKAFAEITDQYKQQHPTLDGIYSPGEIGIALYYPPKPLLGQICPDTPILLTTNFNLSNVVMYQFNWDGRLINYGLPFGVSGSFQGGLQGPQGIEVNRHGEIFIADSMNKRISKWRILQTGQVVFVKTFAWQEHHANPKSDSAFTPTDVATDKHDRLFVTDQFNNVIRVFDREGNSLWSYGKAGYIDDLDTEYENFMLPTSVCVDDTFLVVNDLVNRAIKVFEIPDDPNATTLEFLVGKQAFAEPPNEGGLWMPFFIYANDRRVYVPDSTFNVVNVFEY